ncbi:MAG: putative membrane protein [Pseudomonadales bacterium]|jgi:uncharacterized membrane protein
MGDIIFMDLLVRWLHVLFGITWIGLLYYFNFVQGEYFKEAEPAAKSDAVAKLAPRALWWFRWGAMFTFITGIVLLAWVGARANSYIMMGALMGTFMFLNVWLIIWPNQKIVIGLKEGDKAAAAAKAGLASRTNTLFSAPMTLGMLGSAHGAGAGLIPLTSSISAGFWAVLAIIIALQINAVIGKQGPMTSVKGVIHCSIALTFVFVALLQFV